ncbi:trypsin-like serine protease [Priestia filamentosa]|uniref:trypsin-like serine peptidase n=1 Tax=Priestia filamentosa TaxID=1402861 RepID=UPI0039836DF4
MKKLICLLIMIFLFSFLNIPSSNATSYASTPISARIIMGDDERTSVKDTSQFPYSSVSLLFSFDSVCTGAFIAPDRVLTAAHCVYNSNLETYYRQTSVYPGMNNDKFQLGTTDSVEYYVPEEYINTGKAKYDYAVIKVADPIGKDAGILKVKKAKEVNKSPIKIIGYPFDKYEETSNMSQYEMSGDIVDEDQNTIYYNIDTTTGQSGAPILNSKNEIIGIHTGNYNINGKNGGPKIDLEAMKFIKKHLKD